MINYITAPFKWFFKLEAASGLVLLIAAVIALILSNTNLNDLYFNVLIGRAISPVCLIIFSGDKYDRLGKAKSLLDQGVITKEEFQAEKSRILEDLPGGSNFHRHLILCHLLHHQQLPFLQ